MADELNGKIPEDRIPEIVEYRMVPEYLFQIALLALSFDEREVDAFENFGKSEPVILRKVKDKEIFVLKTPIQNAKFNVAPMVLRGQVWEHVTTKKQLRVITSHIDHEGEQVIIGEMLGDWHVERGIQQKVKFGFRDPYIGIQVKAFTAEFRRVNE